MDNKEDEEMELSISERVLLEFLGFPEDDFNMFTNAWVDQSHENFPYQDDEEYYIVAVIDCDPDNQRKYKDIIAALREHSRYCTDRDYRYYLSIDNKSQDCLEFVKTYFYFKISRQESSMLNKMIKTAEEDS